MKIITENVILTFGAGVCFFFAYFTGSKESPVLIFALGWLGLSIAFLIKNMINKK